MHQFSHVLIIDVPNGFLFQKNLKLSFQKAQEKCIQFSLNLSPRSLVDPSHLPLNGFRLMAKQNTVLRILFLSTGVEWRYTQRYIHKMFKPSPSTYSTRSKMALEIPLWKTNTEQKSFSFLGPKILSKKPQYQKC